MHKNITIDYPPDFRVRWNAENGGAHEIRRILEANRGTQEAFIAEMGRFAEDFAAIPANAKDPSMPRWRQNWFPPLDGMSSFTMIATRRPAIVMEIGSGNSTKFFNLARRRHSPLTRVWSVDPHPREDIDLICDRVFRLGLETLDPAVFDVLVSGDVLFFDGSHRSLQNSDVTVFFIDILPRLADGVIVGLHDIFWPMDYPGHWQERYYSEQYILGAYMAAYGKHFPLIFSSSYAWRELDAALRAALPASVTASLPRLSGGCLWFEKRSVDSLLKARASV
jgi:hypothetical protein